MLARVRASPVWPAMVLAIGGIASTSVLVDWVSDWESGLELASFQGQAAARVDAIENALHTALADLHSVVDFFNALELDVPRERFSAFSSALLARTPYVRGFSVYRHLLDQDRDEFERERERQFPGYSVLEARDGKLVPAGRRPTYRVIDYLEPYAPMKRVFGLDADTASPLLMPAVRQSALTGAVQTTPLFDMVVDGRQASPHVLMLLPLYRGKPSSPEQRQQMLYGWVSSMLRASDLVERTEAAHRALSGFQVGLYSAENGAWKLANATAEVTRGGTPKAEQQQSWQSYTRYFRVAAREWAVTVRAPHPSLLEAHLGSIIAAVVGGITTLTLSIYLYAVRSRSRQVETLVGERTRELNRANARLVSDIAAREAQNRILHIVTTGAGLPDILDEIICFAESSLPGMRGAILLLHQDGGVALIAGPSLSENQRSVLANWVVQYRDQLRPCLLGEAGELVLPDLRAELESGSATRELAAPIAQAGFSSMGAWPVKARPEEMLGVFLLLGNRRGEWSPGDSAVAGIAIDLAGIVVESRRSEEHIRHLAHHDELTGLPNRALYTEHLRHALDHARRSGIPVAVLFLDLDRFKTINDTFGHDAGDGVLRSLAMGFRSCLRAPDTLARLGGDEFIILLQGYSELRYLSEIATRLLHEASKPFEIAGQECHLGVSIGIALFPDDGDDVGTLVKNADVAMYRAKTIGRNNYQFYSPEMNTHTVNRLVLESSLRRALEREEILVYYQPKICVATGRLVGAEALVRWRKGETDLMLPAAFVPFAEEIGLISSIGMRVLHIACRDVVRFQKAGVEFGRIAINLSGLQFNDAHLATEVQDVIREVGISPSRLEFEITESMVMHNRERAVELMQAIRNLGIALSIDDFGTGYSSLSSLKRFPVNSVKIDKSFIDDFPGDTNDAAIVHAIIGMAHSLGLRVTAEGVETLSQLETLRQYGCDEYQGFYFSPALPAEEFIDIAARRPVPMLPVH
ncbi:bifunctional diguanylate cyclase/phosphodiesterase [Lacisediminimonas profundi]|uniref:bifunctional diguanylate cyclase/phosphodiesterase n=1 Tax=Lacisediminimonas profundi TaxID=2603856 RepID=UPI00124B5B33|nr:EAL domain-containing protein [Lacisediminimonas profundi]